VLGYTNFRLTYLLTYLLLYVLLSNKATTYRTSGVWILVRYRRHVGDMLDSCCSSAWRSLQCMIVCMGCCGNWFYELLGYRSTDTKTA